MPRDSDKPEGGRERHGKDGGHRTRAGGTYGDWVPDKGQARRSDDPALEPPMGDYDTGGSDPMHVEREPGPPRPRSDEGQSGTTQTGVLGEPDAADEERVEEANQNKNFDTTHVHSGTTVRKV